MNKKRGVVLSIASGAMVFFLSAAPLPDLTVSSIIAGEPSFISPKEANLPLDVMITNPGDATGARFKVSVDVIVAGVKNTKPFTCPGQPDRWYPYKTGLARGDSYTFRGQLYIGSPGGPSLRGQTITIIARVDSCAGDEFMPDYCRVRESNEGNNEKTITKIIR